jgi:kynurenine formamidase
VRDGVSVSLALELNKTADAFNTNPFEQALTVGEFGGLDNLDLDPLAREVRQRGRWTFLFVGLPLRVPGGTGSPLNPLAIF